MFFPDNLHYTVWGNMLRYRFVFQEMVENIAFRWYPMSLCTCLRETSLIIIIREICIAPFPEVNQTKALYRKSKSNLHKQHSKKCQYIQNDFFHFRILYHIISHVGSGIFPVDGVGRISYGHCLYHSSPFRLITFILFPQSIFLHLILYLLFPRLFRSSSSSTTTHFKFQSLHYHIFIFFPQNMTVPPYTACLAILSKDSFMPNMSINSSLFLRSNSFTPRIARIIALSVLLKIAISFSLKHHASLPYNIADLTQLL